MACFDLYGGPCGGDGFESGVDAEGPKETADVVPERLGAQVELGGDVLCRVGLLQKTKHFDTSGVGLNVVAGDQYVANVLPAWSRAVPAPVAIRDHSGAPKPAR